MTMAYIHSSREELRGSSSTLYDMRNADAREGVSKHSLYRGTPQLGRDKSQYEGGWIESYSDTVAKMESAPVSEEEVDVETLLGRAQQSLEELRLNDAERQFLHTTFVLQEKAEDDVRKLIEAYLGLADVCTRKSRAFRQSPLEWFWLCVHASTLLSEVTELCQSELHSETDNQKIEWYNSQIKFSQTRSQNLVEVLGRTLFNWMNEGWRLVDPNHYSNKMYAKTPVSPVTRLPLSSNFQQPGGLRPFQAGFMNHAFSIESLHEMPMKFSHVPMNNVNWFKRIKQYCHRRLLSKNIKDIMTEIQNMKEVIDSASDGRIEIDTISEETDMDLAKERNNIDRSLKNVMEEENEDDEEEVVTTIETFNIAEVNEKSRTDTVVKEYSLLYELASSDVDTTGWEFFLEDRKETVVHSVIEVIPESSTYGNILDGNCIMRTGEEVTQERCSSPEAFNVEAVVNGNSHNIDDDLSDSNDSKETTKIKQDEEKKKIDKERFSPLREGTLRLTVAKAFQIVAQKLTQSEEYDKAEDLYEDVLQILEEIQDGTVKLLKFNALLLQNTGLLCFRQGNRHNGLRNLEKALKIYKDLQDMEAHREVALVLIDLGNAYADDLHDEALYDKVIAAVCEFFEREASDEENGGSSSEKTPLPELPEDLEQLKRVSEAVTCYVEALAVLENDEKAQKHIIAMATRKLGDCHFVKREYTDALDWYEKALKIHRSSGFHGKDAVLENAHILSMLGVSTFMLHVYPRASHVFELALHMVKHAHGLTLYTFLHSLVLSLLGITYYKMKTYHKCVSMCTRAFETFWNLYEEKIPDLPQHKFWLVCQNLYILGNTYNVLNLHNKGIKFLEIGRTLMRECPVGEKRQHMRILQILGDCYFAQYDYKTALVYYNEALDIGDKVSSSTESEAFERMDEMTSSSASENLDMALHNQLLSRSADAHISLKQYQSAVHYLEQARDMQDVLEDDIKGDLVSTLHQLGQMHSMAGDVDKAIESYKESLEIFKEIHDGELAPEMCITLGNLATMCYVKACICEDIESELEMILSAEQFFQAALKMDMNTSVCVKYANFLYSQANYEDAIMYIEDSLNARPQPDELTEEQEHMSDTCALFFSRPWSSDIVYGGLERVTLPEPLQEEVDAQEEAIMPTSVLAYYILILSYKQTGQLRHAEEALVELMGEVYARDIPFLYALLGYGLMEMGLFEEAALEFQMAVMLDNEYNLALDNYCLCMYVNAYNVLERAFSSIFVHLGIWNEDDKFNKKVALLQGYGYY